MVGLSAMQVHGRANTPNADAMATAAHITAKDDSRRQGSGIRSSLIVTGETWNLSDFETWKFVDD
jgi:hypothetical protein